jgi:Ca2+-binding EF-hand superfamily protein
VFTQFDCDNSQCLDAGELDLLLIDLGFDPESERLRNIREAVDRDKSGTTEFKVKKSLTMSVFHY